MNRKAQTANYSFQKRVNIQPNKKPTKKTRDFDWYLQRLLNLIIRFTKIYAGNEVYFFNLLIKKFINDITKVSAKVKIKWEICFVFTHLKL